MPNYKGHLMGGIAAYALLLFGFIGIAQPSLLVAGEWLIFTLAGALFPDIDIKSKGQKYFYFSVFIFFIILTSYRHFELVTCCSFIAMTPMLVRHRGIFHNPLFLIVMPLIIWAIVSSINPAKTYHFFLDSLFFIIGAFSHIWLDLGTSQMLRRLFIKNKRRW